MVGFRLTFVCSKIEFCKVGGSSLSKKITNKPDNNSEASPDEAQPKNIASRKFCINRLKPDFNEHFSMGYLSKLD